LIPVLPNLPIWIIAGRNAHPVVPAGTAASVFLFARSLPSAEKIWKVTLMNMSWMKIYALDAVSVPAPVLAGMAALQASDKCSHTHVCCAFSIGLRLALEPDLRL
jgi:hypothetical protein